METVGIGMHFEDLPVGRQFKTVGRTITETDIINFVNTTGMLEVLFTNTEFIEKESAIKGRVVPGALAYTFAEGLLIQSVMQGVGLAFLNMELDIKAPTFVMWGAPWGALLSFTVGAWRWSRPGRSPSITSSPSTAAFATTSCPTRSTS